MKLRDETRELGNAEGALDHKDFVARAEVLSTEQERVSGHVQSAMDDIVFLPLGAQRFGKELALLGQVVPVMDEAAGILRMPDAGPPAIAAETEAIELLLQTKRQNPNGGGGGGDPGGGGSAARASSAALTDIGPGSDPSSLVSARPVGQATGRAGREFPDEFRSGLDAYFSNLEGTGRNP
ncbi:MAG TPA: hypothetical protein VMN36_11065 [Verrucomicrobiales bacterium]|nr:hypothetical protein [Verrucomicrobiales bacterium]